MCHRRLRNEGLVLVGQRLQHGRDGITTGYRGWDRRGGRGLGAVRLREILRRRQAIGNRIGQLMRLVKRTRASKSSHAWLYRCACRDSVT